MHVLSIVCNCLILASRVSAGQLLHVQPAAAAALFLIQLLPVFVHAPVLASRVPASQRLHVREDITHGVYVEGLGEHCVDTGVCKGVQILFTYCSVTTQLLCQALSVWLHVRVLEWKSAGAGQHSALRFLSTVAVQCCKPDWSFGCAHADTHTHTHTS